MKQQPGENLLIMGSGGVVSQFADYELIDEYRFIIIPVVLGEGKPYFRNLKNKLNLKLLETKTFSAGNVALRYQTPT